jgi:hypothetical protein
MMRSPLRRHGFAAPARVGGILALIGVALVVLAGPALAAPYSTRASAVGATLTVNGSSISLDSGTQTATNDGTTPTVSASSVVTSGTLVQSARASNDGTTAACAGITGPGGAGQPGNPATCVTAGASGGVNLLLGTLPGIGDLRIVADAIYGSCTAAADLSYTVTVHLINAQVTAGGLLIAALPADPAPNSDLTPAGYASQMSITANRQVFPQPGEVVLTAFSLSTFLDPAYNLTVGIADCGPPIDLAAVPLLPQAGIGVAGGTLIAIGAVFVIRRRRAASRSSAPIFA